MTKMAATSIYFKNLKKIFFSRTGRPMILNLGMQDWGFKLFKVYINGDPGLTLTYFTARSNLVTYFSIGISKNSGFFRNYCIR